MVPLDGSKLAECILPHLEAVVRGSKPTPDVLLVRAVEPIAIPYGRERAKITSMEQLEAFEIHHKVEAEKYLEAMVAQLAKAGIDAKADVIYGKAADVLGDFASKNDFDLVIIASHGRSGISRWALGSVADRLLRSVRVPVLMVRAPGCTPIS
jgi:nucleotide-binding universal stress UspA family protein